MLDQSESLDSDQVRNQDGDEVVDPPDKWIQADVNESLEEKLAAETADTSGIAQPSEDIDDDLDHMDPTTYGRERGQIDGTPEDGTSFFNVRR